MPENIQFPVGTVTFLFSDIEGSTQLLQALGERYDAVLSAHHRILREAFEKHGGVEVGTEGDSFFVVFSSARSGIDAAIEAQRGLSNHDFGEGVKVRVRMGVHTGEGRLVDGNYRGLDVHRAARIAAAGHGGQVLVSETTRALVEGSPGEPIGFTDLGEHRLKDLEHPDRLYQLTAPGLLSAFPPPRSIDSRPNNLTAPVSSFIGREREVRDVRKQLRDNRLVTLTGPGGTGKSRLAVQVAYEVLPDFDDGVFLVALASVSDPNLLPATVAQTLGVRQQGVGSLESAVQQHLAAKDLLLILDNFEHLLSAAFFVSDLLASTTRLKILVTSRAPLRLSSEQEYPVPPLSVPPAGTASDFNALESSEAVRLFVQRAKAVRPNFELTPRNAPEIAEICRRLDGLPLALELAAARIRTLEPHEVARRLNRSLSLLTGGPRDLPARQQTLRNAIAWSYDLLDEPLRDLFAKLGVFEGGFSLEAAEAVCCEDALDQLEQLAEQSMVKTRLDQFGARYVLLGPVREYALERLEERGDAAETLRRHAEFFLALAENAGRKLQGPTQVEWLGRLELENDNLRAVMTWALAEGENQIAARLGWSLWMFWWLHGHQQEGRSWMEELLRRNPPDQERCLALSVTGSMSVVQGDHAAANAYFREAIALARRIGDKTRLAFCLQSLGLSSLNTSEWETAVDSFREALPLFLDQGNLQMASGVRSNLGTVAFMQGRLDEAREQGKEGLVIARRIGDPVSIYFALYVLAQVAVAQGDFTSAASLLREGLAVVAEVGNPIRMTYYLESYALVLAIQGEPERAARLLGAAEALRAKAAVPNYIYLNPPASFRERGMASIHQSLGRDGFHRARNEGLSITAQQAVAYALDRSWDEAVLAEGPFGTLEVEPAAPAQSSQAPPPAEPSGSAVRVQAPAEAQPQPAVVGRRRELARMEAVLEAAQAGRGRAVLISGEPGIGKSRLAEELAVMASARGFATATGGAAEGAATPAYWPWISVLPRLVDQVGVDDLAGALGPGSSQLVQVVPVLGGLAGEAGGPALDPDSARQRLFEAVGALLRHLAERRPLLIVLEDLQWADVPTLQLAGHLAPVLADTPVVLAVTYRPGEVSSEHALSEAVAALARYQVATHLELEGLEPEEVGQLLARFTGTQAGPELVSTVQGRTDGNPFFVTELARLLAADAHLTPEAAVTGVPAGVRDVVGRRLSRLPAETNALLSTAAIVGREFELAVVAAAFKFDVDRTLDLVEAAVAGGLVTEDPEHVGTFRFSHDLVRETILDGLTATRRAILHGNVAEAIEATYGDSSPPLELAYHLAEAAPAIGPRRALPHLLRAAEVAESRLAHEQAEELLLKARDLASRLPSGEDRDRQELEVLLRLNLLVIGTRGYAAPALAEGLERARTLADRLGERRALVPVQFGRISFHNNDGDTRTARRLADELLADVTPGDDPSELLVGHLGVGIISMFQGELQRARGHFDKVMELATGLDDPWLAGWMHQDPVVNCATFQGWCLAVMGDREGAARAAGLAVDRARELGKDFDLAHALYFASALPVFERRASDALQQSSEAVDFARERGFMSYMALGSINHGWALAMEGEPDEGVAEISETLKAMAGFARIDHSIFLALLAEAHGLAGQPELGVAVADQGLDVMPKTLERFYEAELHRVRGELLYSLGGDRHDEARSALERAIEVARSQGARLLEARAAASLERPRG